MPTLPEPMTASDLLPVSRAVESAARALAKPERVARLRATGWQRDHGGKTQCWRSPGYPADRGHYTLAAAIRAQLAAEAEL